jgi:RNA polymerase sigma-70 factor (ECF subfamily)
MAIVSTSERTIADVATGGASAAAAASSAPRDDARRIAEEAAIVQAVLDGDTESFRALVVRYQGPLVTTIAKLVRSPHEAEDLAQQSFADAFDALARFDQQRKFSTWLLRIGVNNAKDWLKSHKRREQALDVRVAAEDAAFAGSVPAPDRAAAASEALGRVSAALAALPVEFREVVVLKDVQDLSYDEIHEILGHPITTLKIRAVRGRAAMRLLLEEDPR